jgi:hypothetical protein
MGTSDLDGRAVHGAVLKMGKGRVPVPDRLHRMAAYLRECPWGQILNRKEGLVGVTVTG